MRDGLSKSHRFCPGCGVKIDQAVVNEKEHQRFRTLPIDEETLAMLRDYIKRAMKSGENG